MSKKLKNIISIMTLGIIISISFGTVVKADKYNSFSDITLPGFLNTTHEDYSNHGIGIGNVISVVKKYEGFMEINRSKGRFNTYIELYI